MRRLTVGHAVMAVVAAFVLGFARRDLLWLFSNGGGSMEDMPSHRFFGGLVGRILEVLEAAVSTVGHACGVVAPAALVIFSVLVVFFSVLVVFVSVGLLLRR